ncbi:hypothetical protein GA0061099_10933, partial [Bradyrhizobium yuanmingense]
GPGWIHRNEGQWAPENLMRWMHRLGVLPSPDRPQTNFMIDGRSYTAQLGPSRKQSKIYVRPKE